MMCIAAKQALPAAHYCQACKELLCPAPATTRSSAPSAYDTIIEPMTMLTTSFMLAPAPTSPATHKGRHMSVKVQQSQLDGL